MPNRERLGFVVGPWDDLGVRPPTTSRRRLLIGTSAVMGGAALDAVALEPNWLETTTHDVGVVGLPRSLDGFAIAQITDAHLRGIGVVEESIVSAVRANDVQLLALTGDIVDAPARLPRLREFLDTLKGTARTLVATLGNWEHWGEVARPDLARLYDDAGVRLLVNEALSLAEGVRVLAGDDSTAGKPDLESSMSGRADATILLTHSPEFLDRSDARALRVSLALAGHTHGGQVRLTAAGVPFVPPGSGRFVSGWYDVDRVPAYVSRGTGTSIAPVRFTCRPELPIFRLRQA